MSVELNVAKSYYEHQVAPLINTVLDARGLRWMIWLMDADRGRAGGVCLFDDEVSAATFLAGSFIAKLMCLPAVTSVSADAFAVMETETRRTYGPTGEGVGV